MTGIDAGGDVGGLGIIRVNTVGTAVFAASGSWAAVVFDGVAKAQGVVVDLVLFTIGVVAFLWGYFSAVQRSRTSQMSVAELYLLLGTAIPARVKRVMNLLLLIQVVTAIATATTRLNTPSSEGGSTNGSTLAFGVLVPVLGLGLNGMWAATHGSFPPRATTTRSDDTRDPEIG